MNWTEAYLALFRMMLGDFERDWFQTTKTDRDDDLIEEDGNSRLNISHSHWPVSSWPTYPRSSRCVATNNLPYALPNLMH